MIGAGLFLRLGEDRVAFAEFDLIVSLEVMELPPDEFVEVWVLGSRDEVAPPIRVQTESLQVILAHRWEEI